MLLLQNPLLDCRFITGARKKIFDDINSWWQQNKERGIASVILAYSLGKAQRILHNIDRSIGPIYLHGAIHKINQALIDAGLPISKFPQAEAAMKKEQSRNALIVAPPAVAGSAWLKKFNPYSLGVASGWMAVRGAKRWQAADKGFALSDHADWQGLNEAVKATGAERIFVTHGYTDTFSKWLNEQGYESHVVKTQFVGETPTEAAYEEEIVEEAAIE